jgi:RNA polymerase subunit RPABC4/transcription elongation factor Spt4
MNEFTGHYNHCNFTDCGYTYDFNDSCPECGGDDITDMSAKEVKDYYGIIVGNENFRIAKMLDKHGDLMPL